MTVSMPGLRAIAFLLLLAVGVKILGYGFFILGLELARHGVEEASWSLHASLWIVGTVLIINCGVLVIERSGKALRVLGMGVILVFMFQERSILETALCVAALIGLGATIWYDRTTQHD